MVLGVDVGYGDTKVYAFGKQMKFPTAVASFGEQGEDGLFEDRVYVYNGRGYLVGERALYSDKLLSTRSEEFLMRYSPLLVYRALELVDGEVDVLVVGLPLGVFQRKRDRYRRVLERFSVNGQEVSLDVRVYPQGLGIFWDYVIGDDGIDAARARETVLVVDVGFNTVDVVCVVEGSPTKSGSTTIEGGGVARICERLMEHVYEEHGLSIGELEAKEILRNRAIKLFGTRKDKTEVIREYVEEYTEWLMTEVATRWRDFYRRADRMVIAGGGAYYVREGLIEKYGEYGDFVFVPDTPEFSNVRGWVKMEEQSRCQEAVR